jgi:hypothetical protein
MVFAPGFESLADDFLAHFLVGAATPVVEQQFTVQR